MANLNYEWLFPSIFIKGFSQYHLFFSTLILIINSFNNLKKMTTFPLINLRENKMKPRENISYLRFPSSLQAKSARYSLQQQTFSAIHHHKYLYIDFQTDNKIFELEKTDEICKEEDEAQQIGDSRIGGFQALSKASPSGYRMHKFLSEEQMYFERKKKWKTLLNRKEDDTSMNFNKIRQRINPEKLQDYLQNKHNEDNWKKINDRQQKLYQQISNHNAKNQLQILTNNQNRTNVHRRLKARNDFKGKIKLKALNKLNSLLAES